MRSKLILNKAFQKFVGGALSSLAGMNASGIKDITRKGKYLGKMTGLGKKSGKGAGKLLGDVYFDKGLYYGLNTTLSNFAYMDREDFKNLGWGGHFRSFGVSFFNGMAQAGKNRDFFFEVLWIQPNVLNLKKMKVFTLILLFLLLVNYQMYSQIIDMDNRNYHYSLKNLDIFGFKKELNQTLNIFNHGIFYNKNKRGDYKTEGGFSSTIWIENENVGRLPNMGDNENIFIKPLFVESKLSKKGVGGFNSTGQINDVTISNIVLEIYDYLITELNINNLIEINEVNRIGDLEISKGIFRRGLLERSERLLNNEIKVSSEDFYIVPIFIQLEENKNNYPLLCFFRSSFLWCSLALHAYSGASSPYRLR